MNSPIPSPSMPQAISIARLFTDYPDMRPAVIDGVLRRGEVCNIIASPKIGKSFLAGGLAWSVATGQPWLGYDTTQGRVLIIDNELHPETLASRLRRISVGMMIEDANYDAIDVLSLRGRQCGIAELDEYLDSTADYSLMVIDALYRMLPAGTSENDNAAMMAIYNWLDRYAARMQAAIVVVHHSSKGDQSEKSLTDVGSGAGAISRAADTHIAIRPHETNGYAVLEAVTRSWKSPEPLTIGFEYPLWTASTLAPAIKRRKPPRAETQEANDTVAKAEILDVLRKSTKPIRQQALIDSLSFGAPKVLRIAREMANKDKSIRRLEKRKKGQKQIAIFWQALTEVLTEEIT